MQWVFWLILIITHSSHTSKGMPDRRVFLSEGICSVCQREDVQKSAIFRTWVDSISMKWYTRYSAPLFQCTLYMMFMFGNVWSSPSKDLLEYGCSQLRRREIWLSEQRLRLSPGPSATMKFHHRCHFEMILLDVRQDNMQSNFPNIGSLVLFGNWHYLTKWNPLNLVSF